MFNLKITQRLMLGFGVAFALLLALAAIAELRVSTIAHSLYTINEVNSVKQRYSINFRGSVHDRAIAIRDVTLAATPAEMEDSVANIERLAAAYAASAKPLDEVMASGAGVTPDEVSILGTIRSDEAAALPLVSEVIRRQRAGIDARPVLMQQARPAFVAWLRDINRFIDLEEAKNKDVGAQVRSVADGFLLLIVVTCGAAMLIGGLAAWWSMRSVRALLPLTLVMERLAGGDLDQQIPFSDRKDEVGVLANALLVFKAKVGDAATLSAKVEADRVVREHEREQDDAQRARDAAEDRAAITAVAEGLGALADGDLTYEITEALAPKAQQLKDDFNAAAMKLRETMATISGAIQAMTSGTEEISQAADDLSRRTEHQAASLEETAAALGEITTTVGKTSESASAAYSVVSKAKGDAEHSSAVVKDAVLAMGEIEKSSQQVSQIIGAIDEIAFQTNLLALNAGVEAARAGDAGRGFAVVASEVRALAQRSAEAAKQIKHLISVSSQHVQQGVKLVNETGQSLGRIIGNVSEVHAVITDMATAAKEQATGLHEVNTAITQMDQVTQQNAAMVEQTTAASHGLVSKTTELSRLADFFRIGPANGNTADGAVPGTHRRGNSAQASVTPMLKIVRQSHHAL